MQINSMKAELTSSQTKHQDADRKLTEMTQQIQQLKDQNALLKAQRGIDIFQEFAKVNKEIKLRILVLLFKMNRHQHVFFLMRFDIFP